MHEVDCVENGQSSTGARIVPDSPSTFPPSMVVMAGAANGYYGI